MKGLPYATLDFNFLDYKSQIITPLFCFVDPSLNSWESIVCTAIHSQFV